nr:hypothetical protein [uncultured Anaerostipes sp.]
MRIEIAKLHRSRLQEAMDLMWETFASRFQPKDLFELVRKEDIEETIRKGLSVNRQS